MRTDPVREMARLYVLLRNLMKASPAEEENGTSPVAGAREEAVQPSGAGQAIPDSPQVRYEPGEHFYKLILPAGAPRSTR